MILKDRVAIVTAAGSGIGRGGAEIMATEGAIVIATDLVAARAEETARRIRALYPAARLTGVDESPEMLAAARIHLGNDPILLVARLEFFRIFGPALAITVIVALAVATTFVPAALALGPGAETRGPMAAAVLHLAVLA